MTITAYEGYCRFPGKELWSSFFPWYPCVILGILVPTFKIHSILLWYLMFSWQFIQCSILQSNTMPSWHNWTNIFDTRKIWLIAYCRIFYHEKDDCNWLKSCPRFVLYETALGLSIPDICHFFLHGQNFWRIKFTPKNANFSR